MQHVNHTPRLVAEQIRIAREEDGTHARHQEHAGQYCGQACRDDGAVIELILQRILGEPARRRSGPSHEPPDPSHCVLQVGPVRPYRPEVQPERGVDDVKDNRDSQHRAGDPVVRHPVKLDADLGKEGGEQQREHRCRHDPVKQARGERVPWNSLGQADLHVMRHRPGILLRFGEVPHVDGVNDQEEQSQDCRHPDQEPRNVNRDSLPPRTRGPLYNAHVASSAPLMARFTRFLISGIL